MSTHQSEQITRRRSFISIYILEHTSCANKMASMITTITLEGQKWFLPVFIILWTLKINMKVLQIDWHLGVGPLTFKISDSLMLIYFINVVCPHRWKLRAPGSKCFPWAAELVSFYSDCNTELHVTPRSCHLPAL